MGAKKSLFGRAFFRLSIAFEKAFTKEAARDTAFAMGIVPFDARKIIEEAGQWGGGPEPMTSEQQDAVIRAYPKCVEFMTANGIITEADFDDLNVPWGTLEKRLARDQLTMSRWRASSYMHPKLRDARRRAREEAVESRIIEEREALELVSAQNADGRARWSNFKGAGFLAHRQVQEVANTLGSTQAQNKHLVSILNFLGYTGKTKGVNRPDLVAALQGMELTAEQSAV